MGRTEPAGTATATRDEVEGLSHDDMRRMYENMLLARQLDERMWLMNRAGRAPFTRDVNSASNRRRSAAGSGPGPELQGAG